MKKVILGVQARSSSSRLPGKSLALIETQTMTDWVFRALDLAVIHIKKEAQDIDAEIVLLTPKGDKLVELYESSRRVIEGSEEDVLSRYVSASIDCDFIVRITGDCPVISPPIITKHIKMAVRDNLDYCSNTYPEMRTFIDGYDCEVLSKRTIEWLDKTAIDPLDREHVTTYFKANIPSWARCGIVLSHIDLSNYKFSVDTHDELEFVRENIRSLKNKIQMAREQQYRVYRF